MGANNELSAMARWDRHEPLANATDFSFFRDDATYRPNPPVADQHVNALVLGYTFDTRPMSAAGQRATYERHLEGQPVRSWRAAAAGAPAGMDVGNRRARAERGRRLRSAHRQRARLHPDHVAHAAVAARPVRVLERDAPDRAALRARRHRVGARLQLQGGERRGDDAAERRVPRQLLGRRPAIATRRTCSSSTTRGA